MGVRWPYFQRAFGGRFVDREKRRDGMSVREAVDYGEPSQKTNKLVLLSKKTVPNLLKNTLQLDRQLGTKSVSKT